MGSTQNIIMLDLIGFLLGFGFLQGLILVAALLFSTRGQSLSGRFMAALIALISFHLAYRWLGLGGYFYEHPRYSLLPSTFLYAWGPLLFLYAYSMSRRRISLWHCLHFVPLLVLLWASVDFMGYPESVQKSFLTFVWQRHKPMVDTSVLDQLPEFWRLYASHYLHGNIFFLQFGVYCVWVFRLIGEHQQRLEHHFSSLEAIDLRWLRAMAGICLAFLMVYFLFNRTQLNWLDSSAVSRWMLNLPFLLLVVGMYVIGFMALRQPSVQLQVEAAELSPQLAKVGVEGATEAQPKTEEPQTATVEKSASTVGTETSKASGNTEGAQAAPEASPSDAVLPQKYKRSTIAPDLAKEFISRLMKVMEEQELYLDSELTMPELAKHADIAPYQVSQILNGPMNQSFFSFVNYYRIELAKKLMSEPETSKMAIVDLAVEVGFKSKSSFYDAFKKSTEMTPTQFKKSLLQD